MIVSHCKCAATSWKSTGSELLGVPLGFLGIREILKLVHFSYLGSLWVSLNHDLGVLGCAHRSTQVHLGALGFTWVHSGALGITQVLLAPLGFTRLYLGSLEFTRGSPDFTQVHLA